MNKERNLWMGQKIKMNPESLCSTEKETPKYKEGSRSISDDRESVKATLTSAP